MILSVCCNSKLTPVSVERLKTSGELKRRFRCKCCQQIYSAYSQNDGETWKWEKRPTGIRAKTMELNFA